MRRFAIAAALCSVGMLTGTARAQEAAGTPRPLHVWLRKEAAPYAVPRYTAFATMLNMASNKFAFLVPEGFLIRSDPGCGILTLANRQGNDSITLAVLDSPWSDASALSADDYRQAIMKDYPTATIIHEFSHGAAGGSGPGFDLQWKASGSIVECKRVMFLSSPAGVLELTATTSRNDFDSLTKSLEGLLQTIRYSTDGVLKIPPLPDRD